MNHPPLSRRHCLALSASLLTATLVPARAGAQAPAPQPATVPADLPGLAVIGFELVDEMPDDQRAVALQPRLAALRLQLHEGLRAQGLYRVVDTAAAQDLITRVRDQQAFVYRCNGCWADVGQRLGVRLVAVGWVQRVSELILNINVSVVNAQTDAEVLSKSVDLRGNTDDTWQRGMRFMLRDWAERRAKNPRYGL